MRDVAWTSSGAVSRSLTSTMKPSSTLSRSSMSRASPSAVEIRVPALNVSHHGLIGGTAADFDGWRTRSSGSSSDAGVPGGSSSYGMSEKKTSPTGASIRMSCFSVRRTST